MISMILVSCLTLQVPFLNYSVVKLKLPESS